MGACFIETVCYKSCIARVLAFQRQISLSLSLLCLISLVFSISLYNPEGRNHPISSLICSDFSASLSLPPSNSCTSMMLCFLPLFLQIRLSLSLFLHLHEPAEHSFPSLQSLAADGSLKARRKADSLLRLLNRCCIQSHLQIFCLSLFHSPGTAFLPTFLPNRIKFWAACSSSQHSFQIFPNPGFFNVHRTISAAQYQF